MSEKPISPLRQRMIEDMTVRSFTTTRNATTSAPSRTSQPSSAARPTRRRPRICARFQLHQTETGVQPPSINATVSALRFFFTVTLDRPEMARHLAFVHEPRKLPRVLPPEEVPRLLEAAPGPEVQGRAQRRLRRRSARRRRSSRSRSPTSTAKRMLLRVEQGKGRKDRHAMLSPQLLELLRDWWRIARPSGLAVSRPRPVKPMSTRQLNRACHAGRRARRDQRSGCRRTRCGTASPRTCWSSGTDIRMIQVLLETTTNCPPTPDRGADLLSVPSALRRDGADSSGDMPIAASSWSSFRSPTGRSPASRRG